MPDKIQELLNEARAAIDGRMNKSSPQYEALDALEKAVHEIYQQIISGK